MRPKKRQRKDRPDSGAKEQLKLPLNESLSEGKQARKLIEPNKAGAPAIGSQGMPKEKSKRSKKDKTHAKQVLKPQPESLVILHGDQVGDTKEGCVKRFREDPAVTATPSNWWGASKFVAAGCLGGLRVQDPSRASDGFTEDTQAELYMKAHAVKTAGKKGLGSGQGQRAPLAFASSLLLQTMRILSLPITPLDALLDGSLYISRLHALHITR